MREITLAALAAATLATPALAAEPKAPAFPPEVIAVEDNARAQADAWKRWADDFSREMRASMSTMFADRVASHRLVKGAPYSARVITETNQPLADGNVISHRHEGAAYRDGEGRTRQETAAEGRRTSIVIDDPVDDKHYVLLPDFKRAIESTGARMKPMKDKAAARIDRHEVIVEHDGVKEVRVQVIRTGDDVAAPMPPVTPIPPTPPAAGGIAPPPPIPPVPPIPGVHTMRFEGMGKLGKGTTTSLGTKDFDGVKAEGKQTVWTIAAGAIGNRNPINVTSETWHSPELQVTVYSRYNDPRTGETIYRLAGIKRGEPPADLFRVPAGYQLRPRGG